MLDWIPYLEERENSYLYLTGKDTLEGCKNVYYKLEKSSLLPPELYQKVQLAPQTLILFILPPELSILLTFAPSIR